MAALRAPALDRPPQHVLGVRLDPVVEGEEDVVARPLGLDLDDVDRAADRVADDRLAARPADELAVEALLEPVETVVVDAREAEHLRGHARCGYVRRSSE